MSIGKRLKEIRKLKGYTQDMLADSIGCSRGVITNIEHDKTTPTQLVTNAICELFNINPKWLLEGTGDMFIEKQVSKQAKTLSEIYNLSKDLSEEELLYVLDIINTFKKHKSNFK